MPLLGPGELSHEASGSSRPSQDLIEEHVPFVYDKPQSSDAGYLSFGYVIRSL